MNAKPKVSVVLAVFNEGPFIEDCLKGLISQDYPSDKLEIIVADGGSSDATPEIIKKFQEKSDRIKLIKNPKKIVAAGLNAAIRQAQGEIIVRMDGHTQIAPNYISQCVQRLSQTEADNVGGPMRAFGKSLFGQSVALATSSPFGVGGARFHYSSQEEEVDTVYLGSWRRDIFEKIGFFDEEMIRNQDDEFNYRLRKKGGRILLSPSIESKYWVRETPTALWRQYFQYGFWKVRVMKKHPQQMRMRQFIPPLFAASFFLSGGLCLVIDLFRPVFYFLFLSYIAANLGASFYIAAKKGWKYFLALPFVYGILHFSYGFGFLTGMPRFFRS